ncbi:hypothetical protein BDY19DRAFT_987996 [Irpex rosettiformis]|uniref:Uncharacterized protein n=2 Tax=Irpex rosettiformis TaxID=378272 RepID=A0ACB8UII1_9APHY|nr:hypothetical protein BDY19DRAFT_998584 [Irpex rosettiformis]KAI0094111.1 hypothetical protein BDY19DRAFT_987996 [Irpex rosettiformis]
MSTTRNLPDAPSTQPTPRRPRPKRSRVKRTYINLVSSDEEKVGSSYKGKRRALNTGPHQEEVSVTIELSDEENGDSNGSTGMKEMPERLLQHIKRIEFLEKENKVLQDKLRRNTASDEAVSSVRETLECSVCTNPVKSPSLLACGHTFCKHCLAGWFQQTLEIFIRDNPAWRAVPLWWQNRRALLENRSLGLEEHQELELELRRWWEDNSKPTYTCPLCRNEVRSLPVECLMLSEVSYTLTGKRQGDGAGGDVWRRYFPGLALPQAPTRD